jgi:hypothetical protein
MDFESPQMSDIAFISNHRPPMGAAWTQSLTITLKQGRLNFLLRPWKKVLAAKFQLSSTAIGNQG